MLEIQKKTKAFVELGDFLKQFTVENPTPTNTSKLNDLFFFPFLELIQFQKHHNGWFTEENIISAINGITLLLEKEKLEQWLSNYKAELQQKNTPKRVGVIMAGNIPMVGFHDFLCVLLSGNIFVGKTSSDDKLLLPFITKVLIEIEPQLSDFIFFTEHQLKSIDAVIATGSNNSANYFEYYFGKYPHIIRKNRNSIAVLDGSETENELENLGKDIFQYFGLGCRNVSKIYIPKNYNLDLLFKAIFGFKEVINNNKYANNFDYNKTIYLMSNAQLLENGFILLKEDKSFSSPVGVLHYEYYSDINSLHNNLKNESEKIQCIVTKNKTIANAVDFGTTQCPQLNDYADGVDTMNFLLSI